MARPGGTRIEARPLVYAILSTALFGISPPVAKVLLEDLDPVALAGLLYIGAFIGLTIVSLMRPSRPSAPLERKDAPWLAGAILAGGVLAPVALMIGLTMVSGLAGSLLTNLEGVATALIAVIVFREYAGRRLWFALAVMTLAGVLLSWDPSGGTIDPLGPLLIVLAMVCWGVDNNLTRQISGKDPVRIAQLKGLIAGSFSLSVAVLLGVRLSLTPPLLLALLLGALSYGISLVLFIKALEGLGSSRTGAFFSLGPFVGAVVAVLFLNDPLTPPLLAAAALMALGVYAIMAERHGHSHRHERMTHTHAHEHDMHHRHGHDGEGAHSHEHVHPEMVHSHVHWPDEHHRHEHDD